VIAALFIALGILSLAYIVLWFREVRTATDMPDPGAPDAERIAVGFFANFFDALGIGSFATSTTYFRLRKMVRDELLPGSLNVGYALPTITQAFIGITLIAVEPWTLVLMIAAAVLGSWFGAGVVSRMPRRAIQVGMGMALLVAAGFMLAKVLHVMPADTVAVGTESAVLRSSASADASPVATLAPATPLDLVEPGSNWSEVQVPATGAVGFIETSAASGIVLGVSGAKLALALIGSFLLGSIMPLGIGYYAPCMVLVALLGMNLRVSFPIMMGACAFLMPISSMKFIRARRFSLRTTVGMTIGGVFGSAIALMVVKSLPLYYVMWLVTFVIIYTGVSLLRTAAREQETASAPAR
jgi:uncharacterized membrane protein YfcA